ncbi:lytic transglycosylase domain-containing protein [bacterium]|nr:lytic transglycosylase domain-containing protein [bacterium]
MQKAKARRQAAKKQSAGAKSNGDVSAVPSKTASAASAPARSTAKAPSGRTIVKRTADKLKIRTEEKDILPAPTFEYAVSGYEYAGDTWAFATFDARKRSPRIVRYYGWHDDGSGAQVQGWYNVDLNPLILQASKDAGVDPLLVEIVMRYESNFNPYARSPVGAVGLMQLMPDTASGLGISDVYDVRDNIRGGAQYIAYQLARFNSVPLALAAYNAGPGAVLEYGGVPPYAETQYYVRTIYGEYQAGLRYRQQHR